MARKERTSKTKKKIYIGIDPDLRLLNAAVIDDTGKLLEVFARRNPAQGTDKDVAVANAATAVSKGLVQDVLNYMVSIREIRDYEVTVIVESQNMEYTGKTNNATKAGMVQLCQTAGCLLGVFSMIADNVVLVQPIHWKGSVPKHINHGRTYDALGIDYTVAGGKSPYGVPKELESLCSWSKDKINPGDFKDISDSIGLALYGYKKGK